MWHEQYVIELTGQSTKASRADNQSEGASAMCSRGCAGQEFDRLHPPPAPSSPRMTSHARFSTASACPPSSGDRGASRNTIDKSCLIALCYRYEIDTHSRYPPKHYRCTQTPGACTSKINAGGAQGNTRYGCPACACGGSGHRVHTHHGQDRSNSNVGQGGDLR